MSKVRLATMWLEGCSGCHMSLLDMDELLLQLAEKIDLVYSPLVDAKEFPEDVDVVLIEGGVGNEEQLEMLHLARERSKLLVSLGDCAVTANVPGVRNLFDVDDVLERVYLEGATVQAQVPNQVVPALLPQVHPLHRHVKVDEFIPGCPPGPELIFFIVSELLEGRIPGRGIRSKFG